MKYFLLDLAVIILNMIYLPFKLFKTKKKITFISRQSNNISLDFELLGKTFKEKYPEYKQVFLCKKLEGSIANKIKYFFHIFSQMYNITTSEVVILDSYCITLSILKQKKSLLVVQIWHAMGRLKKFGYSILNLDEGSSSRLAHAMRMHKNYDYVLASSDFCVESVMSGFNVKKDKVAILPLPRIELIKQQKEIQKKIYKKYPSMKKKINVLYAPTFRVNKSIKKETEELFNYNSYIYKDIDDN